MKHGLSIPPFSSAKLVIEWTEQAEAAGWDGVFLWDHMQWRPGVAPHDPWVLLGAMAQVTERVTLGPLVTPLSRRRPHVVAKHITTLDHLSDGRAVLGVGLGEPRDRDFSDLGDESDDRIRARMLDEALTVIDQLLTGPANFEGEHYRAVAELQPRPVQSPRPPIWVAGLAPNKRPLARARRWDGFVPLQAGADLTPETLAEYLASEPSPTPENWDIVVHPKAGIPAQEYAEAGATWAIQSVNPLDDGWEKTVTEIVNSGPPQG